MERRFRRKQYLELLKENRGDQPALPFQAMKEDFASSYTWMKNSVSVTDKVIPADDFDCPINAKRKGNYLESCQAYFALVVKYNTITPAIAKGWFKSLACAGDMEDAFTLAEYVCSEYIIFAQNEMANHRNNNLAFSNSECEMLYSQKTYLQTLIEEQDYLQLSVHLRKMSGNSEYVFKRELFDVFQEEKEGCRTKETLKTEGEQNKEIDWLMQAAARIVEEEAEEKKIQEYMDSTKSSLKKINSYYTKVVGVTFKNDDGSDRQRIIRDLIRDNKLQEGTELQLIHDPTNLYDKNCIRVVTMNGKQIGCLSRDNAARAVPEMEKGYIFKAFVSSCTGGSIDYAYGVNLRIEVYEHTSKFLAQNYTHENATADYEKAKKLYNEKNYEQALHLLQRAAEYGYADAQYRLGTFFDYGYGIAVNAEKASHWYLKAAEQGHADAQADLGYNYMEGIGVAVDYQKALHWIQKAVEQNHDNAMVFLGGMYEKGLGVYQDYEKCFDLYKQAAELGNVDGCNNTGIALLIGRGVERNPCEAAKWNMLAAEKGHKNAQFNLANQYLNGDGVPHDEVMAFNWMKLAAMNGHPQAIAIMHQILGE